MSYRTSGVGLVLTAVAGLALTACSQGSAAITENSVRALTAQQALDEARANARASTSVHLVGTGSCDIGTFATDLHLRSDGNGTGTVKVGGATLTMVSTPGSLYVLADEKFWQQQASKAIAAKIGLRWVKVPAAENRCLAALGDFRSVLENYLMYPGAPTKENSEALRGSPAQLISLPGDVSIWLSATGAVLPLQVDEEPSSTRMGMSQWGARVDVVPPTPDRYVDIRTLRS